MPGFLGDDQVRRVRDAIDLVQLISEYTPVRKAGANWMCCCPFHQERTPSMHVYADGHYHCYGCKAHGDAITFVREKENVDFADAVELLARRAGLRLEWQQGSGKGGTERGERDRLLAAAEFACAFYERCLRESPDAAAAREYLAKRRLTDATCARFRIGWAPGRGALVEAARRQGIDPRDLLRIDLAIDRDGRLADRFYERVTFPICDRFGHPLAFSARLLPEAERKAKEEGRGVGKYVNNTDTPLYRKSASVFNLHHARQSCREAGRLIVMEGPTDVMAADQAGFTSCVAVLGTALTAEHARALGQLIGSAGDLVLLLDGDRAGIENSRKAVRTCLAAGVPVKVAILPDELDPAELLAEPGEAGLAAAKQVFEGVLAAARPDHQHLLRMVASRPFALDRREQLAATDEVLAAIRGEPDPELRDLHLVDTAAWFGLDPEALRRRLAAALPTPDPAGANAAAADPEVDPLPPVLDELMHLLVRCPELRTAAADGGLEPHHLPAPWSQLAAEILCAPDAPSGAIADGPACSGLPALRAAAIRWAGTELTARVPAVGDPPRRLGEIVRGIRREALKADARRLDHELAEATRDGDRARRDRLFAERVAAGRALRDLESEGRDAMTLNQALPRKSRL